MGYEIDKNSILKQVSAPLSIEVLDEVYSTNDYIKDKDLFCVIAKEQSRGKGTNNRSFFSKKGGIYLSVKLSLNLLGDDFLLLTPFVAVKTARAIEKVAGVKVQIKWVNDIYLNGKKLGGILLENKVSNGVSEVVIGLGLNVEKQAFPPLLLNCPISLEEVVQKVDKNRLIAEFLNSFIGFEEEFKSREFLREYDDRFYLKNKDITLNRNGEIIKGKALGIDKKAGLVVQTQNGVETFVVGDVKII